jgi:general stress protein YciG
MPDKQDHRDTTKSSGNNKSSSSAKHGSSAERGEGGKGSGGNFKNNPEKAAEAGRKGGKH